MAVTNRGSILISTANDIGSSLVDVIGGEGYSPNEWAKEINICGIAAADIPTALDNIEESTPSGTDRGDISLDTGNAVGAVLNKKFNTARGFKPSEWASAISKLTKLEVKTASGAIASFNDGADDVPIESATFEFSPNQDLNGQDAPYPPGGGKNLFNVDDIYAHGFWNVYGSWTNHESYNAYIIKVDPETDYTYNAGFTGITTFLDSNGDYISGSNQGTGLSSRTVTTPANCAYITASISITNLNGTQQIEKGSSSTDYAPYANICPITGYEGLTIYQTGSNLLPNKMYQRNATTLRIGTDTLDGTLTFQAGTYTLSVKTALTGATLNYTAGGSTISISTSTDGDYRKGTFTLSEKTELFFGCYNSGGITSEQVSELQLEVGNSRSAYNAYNAATHTANLGRTIYGGSADVVNGTGTDVWGRVVYTGADGETWQSADTSGIHRFRIDNNDIKQPTGTRGIVYSSIGQYSASGNDVGTIFSYWTGTNVKVYYVPPQTCTTVAEFKAWLQNNNLDVVYEKSASETFTFDPITPTPETALGVNNFWRDEGDSSIVYRADIDLSAT